MHCGMACEVARDGSEAVNASNGDRRCIGNLTHRIGTWGAWSEFSAFSPVTSEHVATITQGDRVSTPELGEGATGRLLSFVCGRAVIQPSENAKRTTPTSICERYGVVVTGADQEVQLSLVQLMGRGRTVLVQKVVDPPDPPTFQLSEHQLTALHTQLREQLTLTGVKAMKQKRQFAYGSRSRKGACDNSAARSCSDNAAMATAAAASVVAAPVAAPAPAPVAAAPDAAVVKTKTLILAPGSAGGAWRNGISAVRPPASRKRSRRESVGAITPDSSPLLSPLSISPSPAAAFELESAESLTSLDLTTVQAKIRELTEQALRQRMVINACPIQARNGRVTLDVRSYGMTCDECQLPGVWDDKNEHCLIGSMDCTVVRHEKCIAPIDPEEWRCEGCFQSSAFFRGMCC